MKLHKTVLIAGAVATVSGLYVGVFALPRLINRVFVSSLVQAADAVTFGIMLGAIAAAMVCAFVFKPQNPADDEKVLGKDEPIFPNGFKRK